MIYRQWMEMLSAQIEKDEKNKLMEFCKYTS